MHYAMRNKSTLEFHVECCSLRRVVWVHTGRLCVYHLKRLLTATGLLASDSNRLLRDLVRALLLAGVGSGSVTGEILPCIV
jgi:hypothetical protein